MSLNIFSPELLKKVPADWVIANKFVAKTISHIYEKQPVAAIYIVGDYTSSLPVSILGVNEQQGLIMQPIQRANLLAFVDSSCLAVLCDEHGKYQFIINQISIVDGDIQAPLPNEIIKIQRREDFRIQAPFDEDFKLILHLGAGQELETKVINISQKGVLIDMRKSAIEPEIGRVWFNAYFERLKSKSKTFTLMVKTIVPGAAIDRIRCGCLLQDPTQKNLKDFGNTCHAISDSRAAGTLNHWHQNVNWIESASV